MSDPGSPENVPARPPLPPQTQQGQDEQRQPTRAYPEPSAPPPNPSGQAPRHAQAPPVFTGQQQSGFVAPSSPGFGAGVPTGPAVYGQPAPYQGPPGYQQQPVQPGYGQPG